MKTTKYIDVEFESSTVKTPEFKQFARDFKTDIKALIKFHGLILETYNVGHFYVSGFISRAKWNGDRVYAYFSISDVRHFQNEWHENILIRTATGLHDYTGGRNEYCTLKEFGTAINNIIGG